MPRNIGLSLRGNSGNNNLLNIKGFTQNSSDNSSIQIKEIRTTIMTLIIIPFMSKQWNILEENICFLDILTNKINTYLSIYSNNEYLLLYRDLLFAFETAVFQHLELRNLEKSLYNDEDNKNLSTMIFKTSMVRLRPEYELYHLILEKPRLNLGEKYNEEILKDIVKLLDMNNVNYNYIKNYILQKRNL